MGGQIQQTGYDALRLLSKRQDERLGIFKVPGLFLLVTGNSEEFPLHKRHERANDAHSCEDVDCRKRPHEVREYAKVHFCLL